MMSMMSAQLSHQLRFLIVCSAALVLAGCPGFKGGRGAADASAEDAVAGSETTSPTGDGGHPSDSSRAADVPISMGDAAASEASVEPPRDMNYADITVTHDGGDAAFPPADGGGPACMAATPNRCETGCTNLKADPRNCGTCGMACNLSHAESACIDGSCQVARCTTAGHRDCTNAPGCETDTQSSRDHCGECGRSCLGGTCVNGSCQPLQLWGGSGVFTMYLITDGTYLYFRRLKSDTVSVLSRLAKNGTQGVPDDLTSVTTGDGGGLTIANGVFYWSTERGVEGCAVPNCGTPSVHIAGAENSFPFTNPSRTILFWHRNVPTGTGIMAGSSAMPLATGIGQLWSAADDVSVYFLTGAEDARQIQRVSSRGGSVIAVGVAQPDSFRLAINSRHVFTLGNTSLSGAASMPGVLRYSKDQTGQTPQVLGYHTASTGASGGMEADDAAVYWIDLQDNSVRVLKCAVTGCGSSPTILAETAVDFPDGGLTIDGEAVYWATDRGLYKVRK